MDSEIQRDGRVLDLTDDAWREDRLPYEDVTIPLVNVNAKVNVSKDQRLQKAEMFLQDVPEQCSLWEDTP